MVVKDEYREYRRKVRDAAVRRLPRRGRQRVKVRSRGGVWRVFDDVYLLERYVGYERALRLALRAHGWVE